MSALRWAAAHSRTIASLTSVALGAGALVAAAVLHDGEPTTEVEANDSGVWVTKLDGGLVGRYNTAARELDGAVVAGAASFDVLQSGQNVLVDAAGAGSMSLVDTANLLVAAPAALRPTMRAAMSAGVFAAADLDTGDVWVMPARSVPGWDAETADPSFTVDQPVALTVAADGMVAVVTTSQVVTASTTDAGAVIGVDHRDLAAAVGEDVAVTTVGHDVVVLDRTAGTLVLPGASLEMADADSAQLQQPGPASSSVLVATSKGLLTQPLGGGSASLRAATGDPAAPVLMDGCVFGAWSGSGTVIRDCAGTDADLETDVPSVARSPQVVYRTNRHQIVLNDTASGTLWRAAETFEEVADWDQVIPKNEDGDTGDSENSTPEQVTSLIADRTAENRPPVAADDDLGVRAGRTTVLPVLWNDVDPDGDVITASVTREPAGGVIVQSVRNGEALQAIVPAEATGTVAIEYEVSDGRGGTDTGIATITVVPDSVNRAPEQVVEPVLPLASGRSGSINVLSYFRDPDGDDLLLTSVDAGTTGSIAEFSPDGTIDYTDGSGAAGRAIVPLVVSDTRGGAGQGRLLVDVSAELSNAPITSPDHVVVAAGQTVIVAPMDNDTDPDGDELRLTRVAETPGAVIVPNYVTGTFSFTSDTARSFDVIYEVADGPNSTQGIVRIDVVNPDGGDRPPIVVADTALLPAGGSTLLDVLANDTDPAGGVLVVQSIEVPEAAGLAVAVLGHSVLRITEVRALAAPAIIRYTVTNGQQSATGEARIIPVPAPQRLRPPSAVADEAVVRAGDVVTIPVLTNDTHPDGGKLTLVGELAQQPEADSGSAFVSEQMVRFQAGASPTTAHLIYRVAGPDGQEDSAQVTIHVIAADAANSPPTPVDLTARVLAGGVTRIAVPLDGIDPDGDSVELVGPITAPRLGEVTSVTGSIIEYRAGTTSTGTDSFRYRVRDVNGAVAEATIRVGVGGVPGSNQPPVAVDDAVTVRPGRELSIAVLGNDSDPDGDAISLVADGIDGGQITDVAAVNGRVVLTSPSKPGTYTIYYTIEDTIGARQTAAVILTVTDAAAPIAPIARDDVLTVAAIVGVTSVVVPVLDNDEDPDGAVGALQVELDSAPVGAVVKKGSVTVPVTAARQVIAYRVTDPDGLQGRAFIVVPGTDAIVPTVKATDPVTVVAGETVSIPLSRHVVVAAGRTARLVSADSVSALEGTVAAVDSTTLRYTPRIDYSGPAAVSFLVTDATGEESADRQVLLTLPVTVLPRGNLPPTVGRLSAEAATGETTGIELAPFATDPDGDQLTFAVTGSTPSGVTAKVSGGTLTLTVAASVGKGTVVPVQLSVSDGVNDAVPATMSVTVTGSTRPMPKANPDVVPEANQGVASTVDVLANDANPFPETPLTVVQASVTTGSGTVELSGSSLVATPAADYVGTMVVTYTIADATGDPDRRADGTLTLTVRGVPDAPVRPAVVEVRSRTVVLTWDPPIDNGARITGYTVTAAGFSQQCATTTCTLTGLTNDATYSFSVVATNAVGSSAPSPESEPARPDERPDPPAAPTLVFGDGSLAVSWTNAVATDRSAIESVTLEISPAPPTGPIQLVAVTGTTTVWNGLANGTAYRVRVQAINRAPEPSDWSSWSAPQVPAAPPAAPAAPTASRTSLGAQSQIALVWPVPANNGDAVSGYTVTAWRGGTSVATAATTSPSATLDVPADSSDYTFTVTATNKAGTSARSAPSNAVRAFAPPGPVTGLSATPQDKAIQLAFAAASGQGVKVDEISYQYSLNGGGWSGLAANKRITGLANGSSYTVAVRAVATISGVSANGTETAAGAVVPFGAPRVPSVSGAAAPTGATTTTVSWGDPGGNGRPYSVEISVGGGGWEGVGVSGSRTVGSGTGQSISLCARTRDSEGQLSAQACATATTGAAVPPRIWPSKGASAPAGTYTRVNTNETFPAGTYTFICYDNYPSGWGTTFPTGFTKTIGPNDSVQLGCYFGYPGYQQRIEISSGNRPAGIEYGEMTW